MERRRVLGAWGENLVKKYLADSGLVFVAQNYRAGRQEIDLIFRKREVLIFIEVKTRIKNVLTKNENPLTPRQTKKLASALTNYCLLNQWSLEQTRLDLVIVIAEQKIRRASLKIYRDILR